MNGDENDPAWEEFKTIRGAVRSDSLPSLEGSVKSLISLRNQARGPALIDVINNMIYAVNHMKHIQQDIEQRESRLQDARQAEPSLDGHA